MDQSGKYGAGYVATLGMALFAMFFGAGNLIFPPMLGRFAGDAYPFSIIGFTLAGVGLPLLGILAVAKAGGGIDKIAAPLGKKIAIATSVLIVLAIGPFFAIPRTAATTFELAILPNTQLINTWAFSAIYFAIVLYFALNPSKAIERIGNMLTPILFISLVILIVKGLLTPLSQPVHTGQQNPFGYSFTEGYQTMDMIASTIFGIAIIKAILSLGISDKKSHVSIIIRAGIISAVGLGLVYGGLVYLGATSNAIQGDLSHTELLYDIADRLLGRSGDAVLGVAVSMACLTTAIGLMVGSAEHFNNITGGRAGYKKICLVIAAIAYLLANIGVEEIINIAMPFLTALYPPVIVMILLTIIDRRHKRRLIWLFSTFGALLMGVAEALTVAELHIEIIDKIYNAVPLSGAGLGWLLPSIIFGILGAAVDRVAGRPSKKSG